MLLPQGGPQLQMCSLMGGWFLDLLAHHLNSLWRKEGVQRRLADVDSVDAAVAYMDELLKRNRIRWGTLSMLLHFDVI